ncbi:predicted protein [Nematostella vectensis]|uniref:Mcm6 C-terminal winged-helix domain-containing protein n=1 Tax=Nematostella vectensis TaxID=45351 RepID=A7TAU8_NEMVE|nr:predicted protein [Nematostella vectensis]|eukprot:XP_001618969.1 hypothetical protein NEMVEDRAFT_v1g224649 [Nematostella vectensis]
MGFAKVLEVKQVKGKPQERGTRLKVSGLRRSRVVNWYLGEIQSEIETEEELAEKKMLVDKVLDRLIHNDGVILELKSWKESDKEKEGEKDEEEEDPLLVVHPNYLLE